ncbi:MAG: carbonic anhydrase [Ignavibacteria bacterium]|nr:carbonic anhydrase [Ignavibacteria bacterium]
MERLITVRTQKDIFSHYHNTPVEKLLEYHNLDKEFVPYEKAELLVGMCMDNRKQLHIPNNFAFILRSGGANFRNNEFKVSYAISIGDVKAFALICHNNCGMVNLISRKENFIKGLVENAGWSRHDAEEHFWHHAPQFEIGNEIDFVLGEAQRLRFRYPKILIAPLFFNVDDNLLYQIKE